MAASLETAAALESFLSGSGGSRDGGGGGGWPDKTISSFRTTIAGDIVGAIGGGTELVGLASVAIIEGGGGGLGVVTKPAGPPTIGRTWAPRTIWITGRGPPVGMIRGGRPPVTVVTPVTPVTGRGGPVPDG